MQEEHRRMEATVSSTHNARRWLTGDALRTLLALRGLQIGDEVRIVDQQYRYQSRDDVDGWSDRTLTIEDYDPFPPRWLGRCGVTRNGVWFDTEDVTHWRLPSG